MCAMIPEIEGRYRKSMLRVPECIAEASGIKIFGKLIKSLAFTTDVCILRSVNADAIMAVYPFSAQPIITHAVLAASDIPVFCGIGGGQEQTMRLAALASDAEFNGALGVVADAMTLDQSLSVVSAAVDIPVMATVVSSGENIEGKIEAGASIINVSGGPQTAAIVSAVRAKYPSLPIVATGGRDEKSIKETIAAGANAITWTPPTSAEILSNLIGQYRSGVAGTND